ncbi:MAG: sigma-70 family RNA polymerase sigma factor [Isosphaeraceae bacterium]
MSDNQRDDDLLARLEAGDERVVNELFTRYRERLRQMVRLRLDRRLQGRIDASDVLQEAYLEVARRAREYVARPTMPPFLWMRFLTAQKLLELHRHHLGARMRDAAQELSLCHRATPQASSVSLAEMLMGRLTSPTLAARRAEMQQKLQEVINSLDPLDREVVALRHFEELSNSEVAQVLGLSKTAASNRYIRALARLKEMLEGIPGFIE